MATKALDLFQAYTTDKLPKEGGYIISSFLGDGSAYSKYEVVAYANVKNLYVTQDGLTFQTDGNKLFVLVEPASYHRKHVEPFRRDSHEQIPHRFSELTILTAKNQTKVMVSTEPVMAYSAFTVLRPSGINFSFVFYNLPDVFSTMETFFARTLNQESKVPQVDAKKAAAAVVAGLGRFTVWNE